MPIVQRVLLSKASSTAVADHREPDVKRSALYYYINHGDFGIVWGNVAVFLTAHILFFRFLYELVYEYNVQHGYTFIFTNSMSVVIGLAIATGVHMYYSHKAFKATMPMQIFLMLGQVLTGQNSIWTWARDHRVHHKFSDSDGDPHNSLRGFFFAHVGWLLRKKHPEVIVKSKTLDYSDLLADPVVSFQRRFYVPLYAVVAFIIPIAVPCLCWSETLWFSFLSSYIGRYIISLHVTWFVNSAAHMFGERPYNSKINPVENPWVSVIAFGGGYHNYHHAFPSDYRTSELGHGFNISRHFIELMARFGYAYDLKAQSQLVVESAKQRVQSEYAATRPNDEPTKLK